MRVTAAGPTSSPRWSRPLDQWVEKAPVFDSDHVYVPHVDGRLTALDRDSGRELWNGQFEERLDWRPLPDGALVGIGQDSVVSVEPASGRTLGRYSVGSREVVTGRGLFTLGKGTLSRLDGQIWSRTLAGAAEVPLTLDRSLVLLEDLGPGRQRLTLVDQSCGRARWSTSDGEMKNFQRLGEALLYSSRKVEERTGILHSFVQLRSLEDGRPAWQYRTQGEVRALYSSGDAVLVVERNPHNPAQSILTRIDVAEGEVGWQRPVHLDTEVAVGPRGRIYLAETELDRFGRGASRFLALDPTGGQTLWSAEGRPRWFHAGEQLLSVWDDRLRAQSPEGELLWEREVDPGTSRVVPCRDRVHLMNGKFRLETLEAATGAPLSQLHTGHYLLWEDGLVEEGRVFAADHDGRVMALDLGPTQPGQSAGALEQEPPFNTSFRTAPNDQGVAYIDWNDTGDFDGFDPRLASADGEVLSWEQLGGRDLNQDGRLDSHELEGVYRWTDSDGNGVRSDGDDFQPLLDGSLFDKGRLLLGGERLWVASGSVDHGPLLFDVPLQDG